MDISRLTAEELWARLLSLAQAERGAVCDLVETLAEVDRRGLHKEHEYVSLFECCVHKLGLSEAAAYRRIRAARALKLFPPIGPLLRNGRLTLESVALLHPFLKDADAATLVSAATGKRVWEVERLVACRRTEEPRRDVVRFVAPACASVPQAPRRIDEHLLELPTSPAVLSVAPEAVSAAPDVVRVVISDAVLAVVPDAVPTDVPEVVPAGPAEINPAPPAVAPRHAVRIAFTADEAFFKLMKAAQAAMRHKYPNGRLDGVFRDALEALLRKKTPWAYRKPGR